MIEYATLVGILLYIGLIAIAPEQVTEILLCAGLAVSACVIYRPAANLVRKRRIAIKEDIVFSGVPLSRILDKRKYDLIIHTQQETFRHEIASLTPLPDLLILPIDSADSPMLDELREIRGSEKIGRIPTLCVATMDKINLNPQALRSLGIVSLIAEMADHETVIRCVDQAVGSTGSNRACERADCFFPVEVKRGQYRWNEFVLNISASGIRMTSVERPKLNKDLQVSFRLPMASGDFIRARGRVVHQMSKRNSDGRYEVGVFLHPIDSECRKMINREVNRLLTE